MSDKNTISHDENYHLYSDSFDKDNIYMELKDLSECCFELWEVSNGTKNSTVRVKIPVKSWERLVNGWHQNRKKIVEKEDDTL